MTKTLKRKDRKRKEARARARWKGKLRSWHELSPEEKMNFTAFLATYQMGEQQTKDNGDGTFTHLFVPRHILEGEPNYSRAAAEVHQKMFEEKISELKQVIREELREATRPHGSDTGDPVEADSQAE